MSTRKTGTILDNIVAKKKLRLEQQKAVLPLAMLEKRASEKETAFSLIHFLTKEEGISIIAEIKKASPSKGILRENIDPTALALKYEKAGAAAISVITEQDFFLGSPEFIEKVRPIVSLPILRKDFIFERDGIIYNSKIEEHPIESEVGEIKNISHYIINNTGDLIELDKETKKILKNILYVQYESN